jgi:pimeloyl-ACP methyl ester carboxylesterase
VFRSPLKHSRTRPTGVIAAVAAVVLAVSACSSSSVDSRIKAERDTGTQTLKHACDATSCAGTRGGAAFKLQLPDVKKWNGTLVIWSHGYRAAAPVPDNPLDPTSVPAEVDRSATTGPTQDVADALVAKGYALAGSAFATNGWDVREGVAADEDLYGYFKTNFGTPKRVYIWGASLGGLITETLAEKHANWVSGVAPLCGVLGGTNLNLDLALDVAYAVKALIYPTMKLTGYASVDEAVAQWQAAAKAMVVAATKADAEGIADIFAIASIAGAPGKTDKFDGSGITSTVSATVQALVEALGYGTWGRYEIEQRTGGNPSQNTDVDYAARIGEQAKPLIGNQLTRIAAALAAGQRVTADAAARAKADTLGNPTGSIDRPTITMHTEDDPLVLVQNENVFAGRVRANAVGGQLVQLFTGPPTKYAKAPYGAGHCNFTKQELVGVIDLLDNWVRYGVYAGPGAVADAFNYSVDNTDTERNTPKTIAAGTATTGYDPNYAPAAWPAGETG